MHLHILGICGTFMGGLAALAREAGHRVTGCDANVYPPMSTQLEALGIALIEGFGAEQLELRPDVFVIGNVVARGERFPLMEAILDAGLPYVSGPQWLAENVLQGRHTLAVAGTHGKTTTSSMLAWILEHAGHKPGFLVGGVPQNFGVSARLGEGKAFVIEADEYDTAFFDKRSKFVHYRPRTAILNNLEHDHADIFPDLAAIETQFHHLVRTVPASGLLVVNAREEALQRVIARGCWSGLQRFGAKKEEAGMLRARGEPQAFDVLRGSLKVARVEWGLIGEHNQLNALAAIAAAEHVGVPPEQSAAALAEFQNVRRRMELRGEVQREGGVIKVYDDFAHHPTAIRTTINGLRRRVLPSERILAIFEPRSNTMKLGTMKAQLPWALEEADLAFCNQQGLSWDAKEALAPMGAQAVVGADVDALVAAVVKAAKPGDHLLCMSNGGFGGIHDKLLQSLAARA
ncbi:UDP-N-acetylmuramate:L-alanyl-gamma-D-glutamyl-meso-diaminopimelate ligase [Pelomonas aquatica]|jgi:UDP-N-acetylmuramate: L-alanyl-gamma-D-glutamyl-meso-diaminopimelate ligase|uniref:UDP-N-acetylmuramate--L-alanyl-gamma-D-glutamyl-meso-2,6-diaminoheptandioate ligase n=1 Tax=Pelomonas aquatica TaxID=431058 RepID=A0A9X4R615_9BURK|nr:UDP-N-acetylmuramate:L-alanyl-gamma-D-glutamyl-meso-diaminopimelate ligase [Pelomonas aquatica]MCY4754178.1 UDP-N-acetylmuramate:L-alanyl-gamma-D-glutamyl-meso-diaminopimelate ligase [Pelomonas aquatica]MDG0863849.1 UDP-N-acetylmuramate:L-alanyl-gamma-D-glutamyl-meso-diaminopimelate ligase [Pelomonas aquatica]